MSSSMLNQIRRFDNLWQNINGSELKRMATVWGASSKLPKSDCLEFLHAALKDPGKVDAAIARMLPHERMALALIKLAGGAVGTKVLDIAAAAAGIASPPVRGMYGSQNSLARQLVERGIMMAEPGHYYGYIYDSANVPVFTDDRILERLPNIDFQPQQMETAEPPSTSTIRRPQNVILDVLSMLRAIESIGGIGLTKAGDPKVNDIRKFGRKMGWDTKIDLDGLAFPEPAHAFARAMAKGDLLTEKDNALAPAASLEQISAWPTLKTLRALVTGVLLTNDWIERKPDTPYWDGEKIARGRLAVLALLRCLPDRSAWYSFDALEKRLFDRIGEIHSAGGIQYFRMGLNDSEASANDAKRQQLRAAWVVRDVPWLQAAFQTWLYAFGIVELHVVNGLVDRFRLTDMGRSLLWSVPLEEAARDNAGAAPAWIVQPNFDIVLFLNDASTSDIAFLEQHAERIQAAQHTVQYRLTRDSIYEGLQQGNGVEQLLETLAAGSRVELPSNVESEIRAWASLRERIAIRRVDLFEFASEDARQDAIGRGFKGRAIGERFVLISEAFADARVSGVQSQVIHYADMHLKKNLHISEDGAITLDAKYYDLVTAGLLDLWAERVEERTWRLTRALVSAVLKRGRTLPELLAFLEDRTKQAIPELLRVALKAWANKPAQAELAEVLVLRCTNPDVMEALLTSTALKPHLAGMIGEDAILIKSASADAVRAILKWTGINISTEMMPDLIPEYYH